jgi:hypothetical protein
MVIYLMALSTPFSVILVMRMLTLDYLYFGVPYDFLDIAFFVQDSLRLECRQAIHQTSRIYCDLSVFVMASDYFGGV